jgi:hypothetical protein
MRDTGQRTGSAHTLPVRVLTEDIQISCLPQSNLLIVAVGWDNYASIHMDCSRCFGYYLLLDDS